jgi:hypothetical protein
MGAQPNRSRRPENAPTVLLQGRVAPSVRDEVRLAADASGVSLSYYLEALINDLVRDTRPRRSCPSSWRPKTQTKKPALAGGLLRRHSIRAQVSRPTRIAVKNFRLAPGLLRAPLRRR